MRIAAALLSGGSLDPALRAFDPVYPNLLLSFAMEARVDHVERRTVGADVVWIDSGAFSVWSSGGEVALAPYIEHLRAVRERVPATLVPINLDVIPGAPRRRPTSREVTAALAASAGNADAIRDAGFPVMEVWHRGEPLDHLGTLLDRRRPGELVGIGGLARQHRTHVLQVCDAVWAYVLARYPRDAVPPLHALGVGSRSVIWRYPWWSCDASSWAWPQTRGVRLHRNGSWGHDPAMRSSRVLSERAVVAALRTWQTWGRELDVLWTSRGVEHATPPAQRPAQPVA